MSGGIQALFEAVNVHLPVFFNLLLITWSISIAVIIIKLIVTGIADNLESRDEQQKGKPKPRINNVVWDVWMDVLRLDFESIRAKRKNDEKPKRYITTIDGAELEVIDDEHISLREDSKADSRQEHI